MTRSFRFLLRVANVSHSDYVLFTAFYPTTQSQRHMERFMRKVAMIFSSRNLIITDITYARLKMFNTLRESNYLHSR